MSPRTANSNRHLHGIISRVPGVSSVHKSHSSFSESFALGSGLCVDWIGARLRMRSWECGAEHMNLWRQLERGKNDKYCRHGAMWEGQGGTLGGLWRRTGGTCNDPENKGYEKKDDYPVCLYLRRCLKIHFANFTMFLWTLLQLIVASCTRGNFS